MELPEDVKKHWAARAMLQALLTDYPQKCPHDLWIQVAYSVQQDTDELRIYVFHYCDQCLRTTIPQATQKAAQLAVECEEQLSQLKVKLTDEVRALAANSFPEDFDLGSRQPSPRKPKSP